MQAYIHIIYMSHRTYQIELQIHTYDICAYVCAYSRRVCRYVCVKSPMLHCPSHIQSRDTPKKGEFSSKGNSESEFNLQIA